VKAGALSAQKFLAELSRLRKVYPQEQRILATNAIEKLIKTIGNGSYDEEVRTLLLCVFKLIFLCV
jgi:hypothetical protein